VVEGAFDFRSSKMSIIITASAPTPLPPHFVRSPLPAIAGRDGEGIARICIASGTSASVAPLWPWNDRGPHIHLLMRRRRPPRTGRGDFLTIYRFIECELE
jgi:hypothetical protein